MYLSYTGYSQVVDCGFGFWNGYVNNTPKFKPDDRLGSIFGSTIGRIFEDFYTERLWQHGAQCSSVLKSRVDKTLADVIRQETTPTVKGKYSRPGGVLLWKSDANPKALYSSPEELAQDVKNFIPLGLKTIKEYYLVGKDARAEVKLDHDIDGHRIAGRADFIMTRTGHEDRCILDGKGTRTGLRYLKTTQLYWYAMLQSIHEGITPDKVGFILWRFSPSDDPEKNSFVSYEVTQSQLDDLRHKVITEADQTAAAMLRAPKGTPFEEAREVFLPIANENNCRFCDYAVDGVCPKGAAVVAKMRSK